MTRHFYFCSLILAFFQTSGGAEPKIVKISRLVDSIANFCTSQDGYESGFCVDYATLKRNSRATHPNATVTTPEEIIDKTAAAEKPPPIKEKPGDIIFTEGNKTTVIEPTASSPDQEEISGLTAQQIRDELRKIIQEENQRKTIQTLEDDPAINFCVRYKERCPKEPVPAEPVQFHRKDEGHIYTREIEFWCTRTKRTAYNYCTEPDLLKVPKYMMFCGVYKHACIDVYKRVIYGSSG
uniref:Uncharacterized protein n=1 Tax=Caenorhabditis japonica TaxID=281687 RepID=A0A8R1DZT4_CAEJA